MHARDRFPVLNVADIDACTHHIFQGCAQLLRGLGETVYEIGQIAPRGDGAAVVVA